MSRRLLALALSGLAAVVAVAVTADTPLLTAPGVYFM